MSETKPPAGHTLGKYVTQRLIGRGRRTEVYRALHPDLHRDVVIKVFRPAHREAQTLAPRFKHDMQAIAALRHPNIIRVHDFGIDRDACFLVMDLVEGSSLRDMISTHPTGLKPPDTLRLFSQIASAAAYMHERDLVHGNIKPDNVLLNTNNRPVLTDLMIPCLVEHDDPPKSGTLAYLAPEHASQRGFTPQGDVYTLGIMLYEMVTGDVPFKGDTRAHIEAQHRESTPLPPGQVVVGLDPRLEQVILKALSKNPADRYASAHAMLGDLERQEERNPYETLALNRETAEQARKRKSEVMRFNQSRIDPPANQPAPARPSFWQQYRALLIMTGILLAVFMVVLALAILL